MEFARESFMAKLFSSGAHVEWPFTEFALEMAFNRDRSIVRPTQIAANKMNQAESDAPVVGSMIIGFFDVNRCVMPEITVSVFLNPKT
jgi:hypothetical protein